MHFDNSLASWRFNFTDSNARWSKSMDVGWHFPALFVFVSRASRNHGGFETIIPQGAAIIVFVSVGARHNGGFSEQ